MTLTNIITRIHAADDAIADHLDVDCNFTFTTKTLRTQRRIISMCIDHLWDVGLGDTDAMGDAQEISEVLDGLAID